VRRQGERHGGVDVGEADAAGGQRVEPRCAGVGRAVGAETVGAQGVDGDEDEVLAGEEAGGVARRGGGAAPAGGEAGDGGEPGRGGERDREVPNAQVPTRTGRRTKALSPPSSSLTPTATWWLPGRISSSAV
jgi:hypothetical protein